MTDEPTDAELAAFLDDALAPADMARLEQALRERAELLARLSGLAVARDRGTHSLGDIWRAARLSCPSRETLGNYLLGILPATESQYIEFHAEQVGCRWCSANLADLRRQSAASSAPAAATRRARYFQSSAGALRGNRAR